MFQAKAMNFIYLRKQNRKKLYKIIKRIYMIATFSKSSMLERVVLTCKQCECGMILEQINASSKVLYLTLIHYQF